jgi:two-component system cell cycle response regulator
VNIFQPGDGMELPLGNKSGLPNSVLIAEDDPIFRRILESWLQKWNFQVTAVENGLDAWKALQQENAPRLAILDWMMPGLDGIELCRKIRNQAQGAYKYLLLLTARGSKEDVVAGLEAGADDYLTKPFDANELRARVRAGKRILELQGELVKAHNELQFEAAHDHLTGLWNRGAIMDLDHFKQINDSYGHQTGDAVLREVAQRLLESVRNYDYVGRYGGEEFLTVLTACTASNLAITAERMRVYVSEKPVETGTGPIPVTISIGLAAQHAVGPDLAREEELVRSADTALYAAKASGGNRVEHSPENLSTDPVPSAALR